MEVTCDNFKQVYDTIENVVKTASFVAIDVEFLGLDTADSAYKSSLFDSPSERYNKQRQSVFRFPPVQLGLAFFSSDENGQRYKTDVFNIYLFKQGLQHQLFHFSTSSMVFLEEHGFDFNRFVANGVSHLNLDELKDMMDRFINYHDGIESFGENMKTVLTNLQQTLNQRLARMRRKSTGSEGAQSRPFAPFFINLERENLSELQETAVLYKLYTSVPGVKMKIENHRLECDSTRLTKRELTTIKEALLTRMHRELMGVSEIFMSIIDARLPIIGHNSLYDLMYVYHYFVADLPDNYETFKTALNDVFPVIIDTKHLAEECAHKLSWHGVLSYRLESLGLFFDSKRSDGCAPRPVIDCGTNENSFRLHSKAGYHNAAYDASVTGHIFIRLAHLVNRPMYEFNEVPLLHPSIFFELIEMFVNRVPVPLLGIPYVNLIGEDPPLRKPKEISLENLDDAQVSALTKLLRNQFGRWRYDLKREDDVIRIATNTDTTCRRVYNLCAELPFCRILDEPPSIPSEYSSPYRSPSPGTSLLGSTQSLSSDASNTEEQKKMMCYKWVFYAGSFLATAHIITRGPPSIGSI